MCRQTENAKIRLYRCACGVIRLNTVSINPSSAEPEYAVPLQTV